MQPPNSKSLGRLKTGKISAAGFLGNLFSIVTVFYLVITLPLSYVFMPAVGQLHQSSEGWVETTRLYQFWHLIVFAAYSYCIAAVCIACWWLAQTVVMDTMFGGEPDYIAWRRGGGSPFMDCIAPPFNNDPDEVRCAIPAWAWEGLTPSDHR